VLEEWRAVICGLASRKPARARLSNGYLTSLPDCEPGDRSIDAGPREFMNDDSAHGVYTRPDSGARQQ